MIVIPCHNVTGRSTILRAVESAAKWMPQERILVIDSASPDKSYMEPARDMGATVLDVQNKHFEAGAWWYALVRYPNEARYYCMHDSCFLTGPLHEFCNEHAPVSTMLTQPNWVHGSGDEQAWARHILARTNYEYMDHGFTMCLGTMMFIDRALVEKLLAKSAYALLPENKGQSQAMERVLGIILAQEGFPEVPSLMPWDGCGGDPILAAPYLSKEWLHRS